MWKETERIEELEDGEEYERLFSGPSTTIALTTVVTAQDLHKTEPVRLPVWMEELMMSHQ